MSVASLHARLPAYEPGRAALQTAALAAFNRREIGGLRLAARLAATREHQGAAGWICFEAEGLAVAVSPLLADGMLARITGDEGRPDGVIAAALLGRIEPLIAAIETIIDKPLVPAGLAETVGPDRLMLRLDAFAPEGAIRHRLLLALPDGLRIDGADLPVLASR